MDSLRHKNGETRQCANTSRVSIEKSSAGKIDMRSLTKQQLNFHGIIITPVMDLPDIWITATQLGYALQYADDKAVQRIYARHADEFSESMTRVVNLTTPSGRQNSRVFSLRGAHLIAMFARTPVAKDFRHWILDLLDREIAINTPVQRQISDQEMHSHNVNAMFDYFSVMYEAWRYQIEPALRAIESPLAGRLHDRFSDGAAFMKLIKAQADSQLLSSEEARIR